MKKIILVLGITISATSLCWASFGDGDMLRTTYDTDKDGIVDNAENLSGKSYDTFVDTYTAQDIGGQKTFDDEVRISSGLCVNTDYLVVASTGNVGIGTADPNYALEVFGDDKAIVVKSDDFLSVYSGDLGDDGIFVLYADGIQKIRLFARDGEDNYFNNDGNLGISTPTPNTRFVVNDGSITISGTNANLIVGGDGDFTGGVTASTFNTVGSAYQINGINIINGDGSIHAFTGNAAAIIVGTGAANIYYKMQFIGATTTGTIEWEYDHGTKGRFNVDCDMKIENIEIEDHLHTDELLTQTTTEIFGITIGSNTYTDGYSSATKFYGDISDCTGGDTYNHIRGGISCSSNTTAMTLTNKNQFYQVTVFKDTSPYYGMTPSIGDNHIEIVTAGDYFVVCTLSISATAKTENYNTVIFKNNGQPLDTHLGIFLEQEINEIGVYHSISMSGLVTFEAGDTVEAWIRNTDAGGESATIRHGHLTLIKM